MDRSKTTISRASSSVIGEREIMNSCTPVHHCRRSGLRSCGNNVEQFSELPQDILVEIFLRFPVKYLIRFKVVCKFWYDVIRSPNFMSLHYKISKKKNFEEKTVPFHLHSYSSSIRSCNLTTTDINLGFFDANVPLLKLTLPLRVDNVQLVGCCNGIVCLSLTKRHLSFALWNPASTQSRLIDFSHPSGSNRIYAGFFFDTVDDSCKLVRVTFSEPQKPEGTACGILNIFTLNDNNKWRNMELPVPCRIPGGWRDMSPVTCLKTCMYWIVGGHPYGQRDKCILCLDVVDEVFKHIIELPSADHFYCVTQLFDYKGSLAMFVWKHFYFDSPRRCFDMWVLNDDCDGTWHKQLTLRPSIPDVKKLLGFISKEGNDIVLVYTSPSVQFLLWDPDSGKTTKVIERNRWTWMYPYFLYSESFASV